VITPSCDLAWEKSATITYLPIISFNECIAEGIFLPEITTAISNLLSSVNNYEISVLFKSANILSHEDITAILGSFPTDGPGHTSKTKEKYSKLTNLFRLLLNISDNIIDDSSCIFKNGLTENEWSKMTKGIIKNSHRPDIHFLPPDIFKDREWSAIPEPSFALLRYPLTIPIDLLNIANKSTKENWKSDLNSNRIHSGLQKLSSEYFPYKVLSLEKTFLHNLITRFIILFTRIGSPDFSNSAITSFTQSFESQS
jgi:hypothetical protein